MSLEHSPTRLISRREFRARLGGISRSTEYRLRQADPSFPRIVPVTPGLTGVSEEAAETYIQQKITEAGGGDRT